MSSTSDILLLGATGFTGRLITKYLNGHPQRSSFTFAVGGRSKSKLNALVAEAGLDDSVKLVQVDVTNFEALEEAVKNTKVVINTAGPFWKWGTPVVRACVRHGVHYVDLTGETPWVRDIITEFDYYATKTGAIIVPGCGMDSIPSDASAFLSNKALKAISPDSTIDTSTTAFKVRGGISGGTLSSMLVSLEEIPKEKMKAASVDYSLCSVKGLPSPGPQLLYKLPHISPPIIGGFFFMQPTNKALVQHTWALYESEAHRLAVQGNTKNSAAQQEIKRLSYGPQFKYDEFMVLPNSFQAVAFTLGLAFAGLCLSFFAPARWLIRTFAPQPGEGPALEGLDKGFVVATNVTSSVDSPPIHVKSVVRGRGDPGYLLTALMISESALSIVLSFDDLPALGRKGGVLTPMTALGDVLVDRLAASGKFEFESGRVEEGGSEGRKTR